VGGREGPPAGGIYSTARRFTSMCAVRQRDLEWYESDESSAEYARGAPVAGNVIAPETARRLGTAEGYLNSVVEYLQDKISKVRKLAKSLDKEALSRAARSAGFTRRGDAWVLSVGMSEVKISREDAVFRRPLAYSSTEEVRVSAVHGASVPNSAIAAADSGLLNDMLAAAEKLATLESKLKLAALKY